MNYAIRSGLAVPLVLFAAICLLGCANDALDAGPQCLPADRIVLLITGDCNGTLEPCDCPSKPPGGLSRRKPLIEALRKQWGPDAFLLDNGNNLSIDIDPLLDRYMLAGLAKLHYDAINVGDQELDRGPKNFAAAAEKLGLPVVATNVINPDEDSSIVQQSRRIDRGGHRILVLGLLGPKKMQLASGAVGKAITVTDTERFMGVWGCLAGPPDCLLVAEAGILLADLDPDERDKIVPSLVGDVDLVVLSTEQDKPVRLEHIGGVPVVYAPAGGKQIALVVLAKQKRDSAGRSYRVVRVKGCPVDQSLPRDRELWADYQAYLAEAKKAKPPAASQPGGVH